MYKFIAFLLLCLQFSFFVGSIHGSEQINAPVATEFSSNDFLNIKTQPLGFIFGVFGLDFDLKIKNFWSFGPSFSVLNVSNSSRNVFIYQLGLNTIFYLSSSYSEDGWILGIPVYFLHVVYKQKSSGKASVASLLGVASYVGYEWHFFSKMNTSLGVGMSYFGSNSPENEIRAVQPILVWSLGLLI